VPDGGERLCIELTGCRQSRLALESLQGFAGARTKNPVDLAGVESMLVQRLLQVPDLVGIEFEGSSVLIGARLRLRRRGTPLLRHCGKSERKRQGESDDGPGSDFLHD
jgi:hypothetical protein